MISFTFAKSPRFCIRTDELDHVVETAARRDGHRAQVLEYLMCLRLDAVDQDYRSPDRDPAARKGGPYLAGADGLGVGSERRGRVGRGDRVLRS